MPTDADTQIALLMEASNRHEGDISKIWEELTSLKVCAAILPDIKSSLKEMDTKIEGLQAEVAKYGVYAVLMMALVSAAIQFLFK